MDIKGIEDLKEKFEQRIFNMIKEFEKQTGTAVITVNLVSDDGTPHILDYVDITAEIKTKKIYYGN